MFQEEGLNGCKNTTWATFILIDAIFDLIIKEETLLPRVMQVTLTIFEKQFCNSHTFFL